MQYPIFLSTAEACRILRIGKTSLYARIKDGSLKMAKMGRATRITFASVIEYAMRCLQDGTDNPEIFGNSEEARSWRVAEQLARQLCHTHSGCDDESDEEEGKTNPPGLLPRIRESHEKNSAGEF